MSNTPLYAKRQYFTKLFNTFCPRFLRSCSPGKHRQADHWKNQDCGDTHGFDQYVIPHERIPVLISEIDHLVQKNSSILDLGCNCGLYLKNLRDAGYTSLAGIDISRTAIEFGKTEYQLDDVSMMVGSFEEVLPGLIAKNQKYDLVYSMGATIELVHPSFDIIGSLCRVSGNYIVLIISEWCHAYPRFYEYEFNRQGFILKKAIRPWNGEPVTTDPSSISSLLVFQKINRE